MGWSAETYIRDEQSSWTENWASSPAERHYLEIHHGTQCGEVYDELGVPTQVSMAGQCERISECPLEKWLETSCQVLHQMVSRESATVALFGKWILSSVIYLTITRWGHLESMQISKPRPNIPRREHRKELWRWKPCKAWSLRNQ